MLLLAALSYGCGTDTPNLLLPPGTPPGGATTSNSSGPPAAASSTDFGALAGATSAQAVGAGSEQDAASATHTADAVVGALAAGALDAVSPTGGAVVDAGSGTASGAQAAPDVGSAWERARAAVVLASMAVEAQTTSTSTSTSTMRMENGELVIEDGGTHLNLNGVEATFSSTSSRLETLIIQPRVRIHGHVSLDGVPEKVDLRILGIGGAVARRAAWPPAIEITVSPDGISASGVAGPIRGELSVRGLDGTFTDLAGLNAELRSRELKVRVPELSVRDAIKTMRLDGTVLELALPAGERERPAAAGVHGTMDATLSPSLAVSKEGRIGHLSAQVLRETALELKASHAGPYSGTLQVSVHYTRSGLRNNLTIVFRNGKADVSGTVTNISGEEERVTTAGDVRKCTGSCKFRDGRRSEHELDVMDVQAGRVITFRVKMKDPGAVALLTMTGRVRADRSVQGNWTRTSTPVRSGTFRVTPGGVLELATETGAAIARATMTPGWNKSL
jgi:hypothetical protein